MSFPRDTNVLQPAEIRRTMSAAQRILARLQDGPASMQELIAITPKYTQRVSDLRKAGYDVRCREDAVTGSSTYFLVGRGESGGGASVLNRTEEKESSTRQRAVGLAERQDLRADNETAPRDVHDLNSWSLT